MLKFKRKKRESSIPTSSMADVAFLLLIFFIVTTHFLSENGIFIEIPVGKTSGEKKIEVNPKNVTEVLINADGNVAVKYMDNTRPIDDINQLEGILREQVNLRKDTMIILIKADRMASYQRFIDVMNQVKKAEVPRYSLVTR